MIKLLVMTDLHITAPNETIIGLDTHARFCAARDRALHDHPDAAALILMGDLCHHGAPETYARLAQALAHVEIPIIPMIGNHDRRDAFQATFSDAPRTSDGHVQSHHTFEDHHVITLDTLDGPPYAKGHHSGWLCDARLAWLDAALAKTKGAQTLVFAHHPPFDTGIVGMDLIKLRNGPALLDRLAAHGRCHLVCGHIHRTISGSTRGVPWTMFKSTGHQAPLDLITPDSTLSIDEPAAFGVVLLMPDSVVAHSEDVGFSQVIQSDAASG